VSVIWDLNLQKEPSLQIPLHIDIFFDMMEKSFDICDVDKSFDIFVRRVV
jgi:hypothetical protein